MITTNIEVLEKQIESFPPLPSIATEVMALTANPESTANDLMRAIQTDQTMCTAILKVANSAFFGIPRGVATLERAVVVLGFEEIRNIVIGKALFSCLPKMNPAQRQSVSLFWQHAFTCGLAAKIMAASLGYSASEFFLAGLFHDIGKLAMLSAYPEHYVLLRDISGQSLFDGLTEEKRDYGVSHDRVGLMLANRWLLPQSLVMAIGFHHYPASAPEQHHFPLLVQTADSLALLLANIEIKGGEELLKIFDDFLPETKNLWRSLGLSWDGEKLGAWYAQLQQTYQQDLEMLNFFSSR